MTTHGAYKIRIKNKYLIIAAVLILSAAGLAKACGDAYLFKMGETARQNHDPVKALAYYDRFLSEYPNSDRVPLALYWSASLLRDSHTFTAVIFPTRSSVAHKSNAVAEVPEGVLSRLERLEKILTDYPDHWTAPHALNQFATALYHSGDPRAEGFLLEAARDERCGNRANAAFLLVDTYMAQGRSDEALDLLEYCAQEMPTSYAEQRQIKMGDVLAAIRDYEAARAAYEETLNVYERTADYWRERDSDHIGPSPADIERMRQDYREQVDAKLAALNEMAKGDDNAKGSGIVEGRVLLAGRPLSGVKALVHEVNDETRFSADYSAMPWQSVGDDGAFRFSLPSGRRYEVGIALNSDAAQSVEGYHLQMIGAGFVLRPGETRKVELHFVEPVKVAQPEQDFVYDGQPFSVRWQAYPNARSYRVRLGYVTWGEHGYSSMGTSSMRTIDTHLTIDRIPAIPFGAYGGDAKGVFPTDLIGRPDAYSLQIEAIDEDGNVISSSSGLHFGAGPDPVSVINAKKTTPTEAERLLLERNYDEAVAKLEEAIAKNPDDIRALEILSRVYFMGAYHIGDAVLSDDMAHRDWQRSRDMLTRLVALEPSRENFSALATVCMNMRDRAGAVEAYHMMLDQGSADSSALNLIAYHALTVDDDYLQALAYLEQAKTHAEHYSDVLPLCGLLVLTGHCDEAVQALHTIRSMGVSTFADRGIELERTLRDYAASRSRWSRNWRNDYLGIASQSFREAEQAWRSDAGAHGSFLILIAKLSDPWCHQRRDELQTAMSDFRTKHGKDAPVLLDVLEAFAQVGGV